MRFKDNDTIGCSADSGTKHENIVRAKNIIQANLSKLKELNRNMQSLKSMFNQSYIYDKQDLYKLIGVCTTEISISKGRVKSGKEELLKLKKGSKNV